jgi:transcriptional regulator with XRE-family HTH domain
MLGKKLQTALKSASITAADAAAHIGISEANLYKLFKKDSFEVAYLIKSAELLNLPVSYFFDEHSDSINSQIGDFNQAGNSNTQKIKVTKAPAHELAQQLDTCQRDNESLKSQLALANALVAAKDETITLLRASVNRPN